MFESLRVSCSCFFESRSVTAARRHRSSRAACVRTRRAGHSYNNRVQKGRQMILDLDKVYKTIAPQPLTLKLDGREYIVKALSKAQAMALDELRKKPDGDWRTLLCSVFVGDVPACIRSIGDPAM